MDIEGYKKRKSSEEEYNKAIIDSWLVTTVAKNRLERRWLFKDGSLQSAIANFFEAFNNFFDLTHLYIKDEKLKNKTKKFLSNFYIDSSKITIKNVRETFREYALECKKVGLIGEESIMVEEGFENVT